MKHNKITRMTAVLAVVGICAGAGTSALADVTFSGSLGSLSASVTFGISSGNLVVTLDNTGTSDPSAPNQILTAVFFDLASNPSLGKISAITGGTIIGPFSSPGGTDAGGSVGGEWAYRGGGGVLSYGAHQGISSAGFGVFGPGNLFGGTDLQPPVSPDGIEYGITTSTDATGNDNGGLATQNRISHSVVFTLGPFSGSLSDISNITFQYGTAVNTPGEPHFPPHVVPEPTTFIAGALLLLPFGASALRIMRRKNQ